MKSLNGLNKFKGEKWSVLGRRIDRTVIKKSNKNERHIRIELVMKI